MLTDITFEPNDEIVEIPASILNSPTDIIFDNNAVYELIYYPEKITIYFS